VTRVKHTARHNVSHFGISSPLRILLSSNLHHFLCLTCFLWNPATFSGLRKWDWLNRNLIRDFYDVTRRFAKKQQSVNSRTGNSWIGHFADSSFERYCQLIDCELVCWRIVQWTGAIMCCHARWILIHNALQRRRLLAPVASLTAARSKCHKHMQHFIQQYCRVEPYFLPVSSILAAAAVVWFYSVADYNDCCSAVILSCLWTNAMF